MITTLYILICGLGWRFVRGITYSEAFGWPKWIDYLTNKYAYAIYTGAASGFLLGGGWAYLYIPALMWAVMDGHKRGFLAVHGDSDRTPPTYEAKEGYKLYVDPIAELIYGNPKTKHQKRIFGVIWMAIQYTYKLAPMVAVKVWILSNMGLLLSLPALAASFGVCYYLSGIKYTHRSISYAEIAVGLILFSYMALV